MSVLNIEFPFSNSALNEEHRQQVFKLAADSLVLTIYWNPLGVLAVVSIINEVEVLLPSPTNVLTKF